MVSTSFCSPDTSKELHMKKSMSGAGTAVYVQPWVPQLSSCLLCYTGKACQALTSSLRTPTRTKMEKKKKKSETTVTDKVSAAITSEEKEKNLCNYRGRNCWRLKKICGMNKDLAVINRAPATGQICCALGRVKRAMNCFTSSDGEFLKKHV